MRELADVINQLLEVSSNNELNIELSKIKRDIGFTAPELMSMRWDLTNEVLSFYIPNPVKNDETIKITSIFSTLTEDEVKKRFTD